MGLHHFGLYQLTLVEAGYLIAKCLWFRGEIDVRVPVKDVYSLHDKDLTEALSNKAKFYTSKLVKAVNHGSLEAIRTSRNLDDIIQPSETCIDAKAMADWCSIRGIELGEAFYTDYLDLEDELARRVSEFVEAERSRSQSPLSEADLKLGSRELFLSRRVLELEEEIRQLKQQAAAPTLVSERQQSAYLRIVGSLLALLLGKSPAGKPYSSFESQQAVIDAIHGHFGERAGLSRRNLEDKFARGKRLLGD